MMSSNKTSIYSFLKKSLFTFRMFCKIFCKYLTENGGTFTGFFMIKIQAYACKEQQPESLEYSLCIQFTMALPTFLPQIHWVIAIGSWVEET